jgi:transposase
VVDRSGKITEPKSQTMKAKRRRHEPEFKARVGLEALKGIRTIQEIAKEYQVHPLQVSDWKKKMLEGSGDVFKAAKKKTDEESFEAQREQLHAKIGQQAVEIDQQIGRIFTRLEYPNNDGNTSDSVMDNTYHHGLYSGGEKPSMRSITYGRFKIIKYDVAGNESQVTQLFDLQENPFELLPEHGTPNLATQTAYASVRQRLEEELTRQRIENSDPYAMLGDRTLLRFENNLDDSLPYGNDGTAHSGNTGAIPAYSATVPNPPPITC